MNTTWVNTNLYEGAKHHPTSYLNKLVLEATQIASTALHENGLSDIAPYRKTHTNHPLVRWAGESSENIWLLRQYAGSLHDVKYGYSLGDMLRIREMYGEQRLRELYDRGLVHKSMVEFTLIPEEPVDLILPDIGVTARPKTLSDFEPSSPLLSVEDAYREYFTESKRHEEWFDWNEVPDWV